VKDTTASVTRRLCLLPVLLSVLIAPTSDLCAASPVTWTHLSTANGDLDPPNSTGIEQTCTLILDIDKDGLSDFVVVERTRTPSVVWYRRSADGWTKYIIDDTRQFIEAGGAYHDIDGDGDLDVAFGGDLASNQMWWWENPYPAFAPDTPWTRHLIKDSGEVKHHDQAFGDVDGDGQVEFITWNQRAMALFLMEIPADPRHHVGEWSRTAIFDIPDTGFDFEGLAIADIDLDGKLDIAGAGRWFKHISGTTFQAYVIDGDKKREFTRTAVGQLVPGGRPEVVIASGDSWGALKWYDWNGTGWDHHLIRSDLNRGHSLDLGDVNGDGHLDIFAAEMGEPGSGPDCRMWVYYGDGVGHFTEQLIATGIGNHESKIGDLDGDGDIDILTKPYKYNE